MPQSQSVEGIANGHWERSEPRTAWLLLLARMGVAELRMLSDWARATAERSDARAELRAHDQRSPKAFARQRWPQV